MDAIRCREWRIFPGLTYLNDKTGFIVFVLLHIPLFYWLMSEIQLSSEKFRMGFDYFLIAHFILHLLFLRHKKNEFKDRVSWIIITGAGLSGFLDLITK